MFSSELASLGGESVVAERLAQLVGVCGELEGWRVLVKPEEPEITVTRVVKVPSLLEWLAQSV